MNEAKLSDVFPIVLVEDDISVNKDADISFYYKLNLPDFYALSETDYTELRNKISAAIDPLPVGTCIQKFDFFLKKNYMPYSVQNPVLENNEKLFSQRVYMDHLSFLVLCFVNPKSGHPSPLNSALLKTKREKQKSFSIFDMEQKAETFRTVLSNPAIGFTAERMDTDEIIKLLYRYTTLDFSGDTDTVAANIEATSTGVQIGNQLLNVLHVADWPEKIPASVPLRGSELETSFTSSLGMSLYQNHFTVTTIKLMDTKKHVDLMAKRADDCGIFATKVNQTIEEQLTESINELQKNREKLVEVDYNIFTFAVTADKVQRNLNDIQSACSMLGLKVVNEGYLTYAHFFNNIPGNPKVYDTSIMGIDPAVCLWNLETVNTLSGKRGINGIVLTDPLTGIPVELDLWATPKRNMCIIAPTRGGKSFLMNYLSYQEHYLGVHNIIVDIGGSYERTCSYLNGKYIKYSLNDPISFNPFTVTSVRSENLQAINIAGEEDLDNNNIFFLRKLLFTIWGKSKETEESKEIMARLIIKYYLHSFSNNKTPCFKGFYEFIDTFEKDFLTDREKESYFRTDSLKLVLKPFYDGIYKRILNGTDNISLASERFVVFELAEIRDNDDILPVVMLIITETVLSKFRAMPTLKKRFTVDEAWVTLKGRDKEFLEYQWRTCAKCNAASTIVTQGVQEIMDAGSVGQAIVVNSGIFIFLDHSQNSEQFPRLQEVFGLTPSHLALVKSINTAENMAYRDIVMKTGSGAKKYRVEVGDKAKRIFTSHAPEIAEINKYAATYNNNLDYMVDAYIEELNLKT